MKKLLIALALSASALAAPAQASNYPTEIAIGPTLGLAGPGLAWRQFVTPWLGFQVGANSWGIAHFAGGTLLLSPIHDHAGQRIYLGVGAALGLNPTYGIRHPDFYPAVGVGASKLIRDNLTFYVDASYFPLKFSIGRSSSTIPFVSPQLGFLYTF